MTRAYRRDANTKDGSVIAGLRLEPELAAALREFAVEFAAAHEQPGPASVAAAARHLLREALSKNRGRHVCSAEAYFQALTEARRKIAEAVAE